MDSLRRLVHGLRVFDRAAERSAGLSAAQLFVLSKLADGSAASVNELAQRTCTHQSSVSVVAQKLADRGLVQRRRAANDGRLAQLKITSMGRRALARAPAAAQDRIIAAVGRFGPRDQWSLAGLLDRLVEEAGLSQTAPSLFFEENKRKPRNDARKRA
jgi:DNA-binding MarR family transcriptional regulator